MNVRWCMAITYAHNAREARDATRRAQLTAWLSSSQLLIPTTKTSWFFEFETLTFIWFVCKLVPVVFARLFTHNHIHNNNNKRNQTKAYRFQMNSNESCRSDSRSRCDTDFGSFRFCQWMVGDLNGWWVDEVSVQRKPHLWCWLASQHSYAPLFIIREPNCRSFNSFRFEFH